MLLFLWPAAQAQSLSPNLGTSAEKPTDRTSDAAFGGQIVLLDQTDDFGSGFQSQFNASPANSRSDVTQADDFTIPNGLTWTLERIVQRGFYLGGATTGACERANLTIWSDTGTGAPDAQLFNFDDIAPDSDNAAAGALGNLVFDITPTTLTSGTYWFSTVCEGAALDYDAFSNTGGRFLVQFNNNGGLGSPHVVRNLAGIYGEGSGWVPTTTFFGTRFDMSFGFIGTQSGTALFPQLTVEQNTLNATSPPDATTTRVLTLRNTGTDVLTYSIPEFNAGTAPAQTMPGIRFAGYPTLDAPRPGGSVFNRTGMDAFGYVLKDNDEADGPAYNFTDISATGTALGLGDDNGATIALPFTFDFYGSPKTTVGIASNGYLSFGTSLGAFGNATIPTAGTPNDLIAVFWDDLNPADADSDDVYYQDMGDGRFIVQWEVVAFLGSAGEELSFQAVLFQDGAIEMHYRAMGDPNETATIGIENATGTDGFAISFNEPGYATAGRAIRAARDLSAADFITNAQPSAGTLAPGANVNVTVTFDAAGLAVGTYNDALDIVSNGGNVSVPATLEVVGPPEIFVDPLTLQATLDSGETETRPITITNTGLEDLEFSFAGYSDAAAQAVANFGPRTKITLEKGQDGVINDAQSFGSGGPDGGGYVWVDSDEAGGPAVAFQDISGTGTEITDTDWTATGTFDPADEGAFEVTLPFSFPFYDGVETSITVNTNGFAAFDAITTNQFTNQAIPVATAPNGILAPFWDDLNLLDNGSVFYGSTPDGRFAIQFEGVSRFADAANLNTFQIILGQDGTIEYQYATMSAPVLNSATVGIENPAGDDGLQIAFNAAYVKSNFAVLIGQEARLVSDVSPASGTVAPGASITVTATVDASELFAGTYSDDLVILSNDPVRPSTLIDVQVTVTGDPAFALDRTVLRFGEVFLGGSRTRDVTVTNTGTDALTIGSISSSNSVFATTGAGSSTLAPGQSTTFTVRFTPSALSTYSGIITVNTNAGPATVEVSGVASPAPVASVTPESLDPASAGDVDELVLMNDGVGPLDFDIVVTEMAMLPAGAAPNPIATVTDNPLLSLLSAAEPGSATPPVMAGANSAPGDVLFSGAFTAGTSALGITQSPEGAVYVADINSGLTQVFDADLNSTGTISHPVIAGGITAGIAYNANTGTLWIQSTNTTTFASTLIEANLDGTATGNTIALPNSGGLLTGVEFSPSLGRYYYVDISNDDIVAVDQDGNLVAGYPVPQTSGDDGTGSFGNGLDVLGSGLDVVFGASTGTQATDAVVTDLNGVNVGLSTPFAQTGDTFVNDVTRSRIAPNEIMYVVGNSSSTIYAIEPSFREDLEGGGGGTEVDYVTVSPASGRVQPAQNRTLTVTYDDEGLAPGTYMAMIVITTNDPLNPTLQVPVTLTVAAGVANENSASPVEFSLDSSAPNPAVGKTAVRYAVPQTANVLIEVYDLMGRRVATLVDGEQTAGRKTIEWDASSLAGGVYVYRMTAGSFATTMKMVVVR